jgi:hypothetical protein
MISSIQEDVQRFYVNTVTLYMRDMSISDFGIQQGSWNQSQVDTKGELYHDLFICTFDGHLVISSLDFYSVMYSPIQNRDLST